LGAYEHGAVERLIELGWQPVAVSGVSIGATTAAAVAGARDGAPVTIAYAAERLGLKHNSTVELVDRSEREGLLTRTADPSDKRRAILEMSNKGRSLLDRLASDHADELKDRAPRLIEALEHVRSHAAIDAGAEAR